MKIVFSIPCDLIYDIDPYNDDSCIEVSFEDGPEPRLGEPVDIEIFGNLIPESFLKASEILNITYIVELITTQVDIDGNLFTHVEVWSDDYPNIPFMQKNPD